MDVQNALKTDDTGVSKPRVLVIDDEENVCDLITLYFEKAGYEVMCAGDGSDGIEIVRSDKPDLVILDLMLPGMDGLDVCREIRKFSNVPLIMLTAKVDEVDRVLGLEMGADDYVTKPFSPRELLARVKAVLRRAAYIPSPDEQQVLNLPGLTVSRISREVIVGDARIDLTPKEFDLLWYLASNRNRVFTREQLLEQVWAYQEFYGDERTVDQHIKRLRRKIETSGSPCRITTIWGVGYKFEIRDSGGI
ncbi:MAG: response regulator transcription factor [Armatimonadetes bacterium]|jgi:DNA-binding response OmpR family regulator|nr:response regulator transcription factor [Armatimonadota bacterium]